MTLVIDIKYAEDFEEGFATSVEWFKMFEEEIFKQADFKPGMNSAVRRK